MRNPLALTRLVSVLCSYFTERSVIPHFPKEVIPRFHSH